MRTDRKSKLDWENQTVFKDSVLGYINVPKAMVDKLIDNSIFQRLQDVAQTGMEFLYPGATHNRFCHSIGVYNLGKMGFHCFRQNVQRQHEEEIYRQVASDFAACERVWNRWRLLFELAALLHDCGHSPLSHSLEFLYNVGRSGKRCDEILCELFQSSPCFQRDLYGKNNGAHILKNAYGAPHERMSACMLARQDGYCAELKELIEDQMVYFDAVHPELDGSSPEYGESEFFSDLEFMARAIIGCPYTEDSHFWGDEENHREIVYQLRNCIINLLHGIIDVDNIDYSIRDASSSGYKSAQVDYERLLKAETIALSYDHRVNELTLHNEPFDHSLLLFSFVSDKIKNGGNPLDLVISGSMTILVEWDENVRESQEGFLMTGTMIEDDDISEIKGNQRVIHLKHGSSAHLHLKSGTLKIMPRDADKEVGTQVYIRSDCLSGVFNGIVFAGNHSHQSQDGDESLNNRIRKGKLRISPAFHKSALSVIQGALDATNFESRWIYSHHVTTYNNNFLSVFLLEMCADYYFEKGYRNLLKRLNQILKIYPRFLGRRAQSVDEYAVECKLGDARRELISVREKLGSGIDAYPELKNPALPEVLPSFSSPGSLEIYSLLLDAVCKLCRTMPLIGNELHSRLNNQPCDTLVAVIQALRSLPTEFHRGENLSRWEQLSFDEDRQWVKDFKGYPMGMEIMKAMLGMPEDEMINGQRFFRISDSDLRSMYRSLARNATRKEKDDYRDLLEAIEQSETRRYLKTMWKSHAEFHFYIHGWKQDWLKRPGDGLSLLQQLFDTTDAPHDPENSDILYMYFSDRAVQRYNKTLNDFWNEVKEKFSLDILVYVPQKIRHKELKSDQTYVIWKNRVVTLSDIGIQASHAPNYQYFYLYYRLADEKAQNRELDVCAFMDFLREKLIEMENEKPSPDAYVESVGKMEKKSPEELPAEPTTVFDGNRNSNKETTLMEDH